MADPVTVKLRALSVVQTGILRKGIAEILVFASGDCYCVCLAFASFQCCKHRVVLSFLSVHRSQCTSASIHSKYSQESLWTSSFLLGQVYNKTKKNWYYYVKYCRCVCADSTSPASWLLKKEFQSPLKPVKHFMSSHSLSSQILPSLAGIHTTLHACQFSMLDS